MNLYQITEEDRKLNDLMLGVETEDDNDAVIELMDEISSQIQNKGTGIIKARICTDSNIKAVDEEIKRLQAIKKSMQSKQSKFNEYVLFCMDKLGIKKIETPLGIISTRKSPASLVVEDESIVPNEFIVIKQTESIDKTAIKNLMKKGESVEGCRLVTDKKSLVIK